MHTIYYSPASPYSAKVRMAAALAGIDLDAKVVDILADPQEVLDANPLGRLPTMIAPDGEAIYDSRVMTQYLNRLNRNSLFPTNAAKRLEAERLEALADGITDSLLAHVYERRFRPAENVETKWLERQWSKATRGLDALNSSTLRLPKKPTAGHIALRALLGYLDLRFDGQWERGRAKLVRWAKKFDERHPELVELLPHA